MFTVPPVSGLLQQRLQSQENDRGFPVSPTYKHVYTLTPNCKTKEQNFKLETNNLFFWGTNVGTVVVTVKSSVPHTFVVREKLQSQFDARFLRHVCHVRHEQNKTYHDVWWKRLWKDLRQIWHWDKHVVSQPQSSQVSRLGQFVGIQSWYFVVWNIHILQQHIWA